MSVDSAPAPTRKPWWNRLLKAGLIAVAVYFTYRFLFQGSLDWGQLSARVAEASWPTLAAGVALLLLRFSLWDWRFRLAARRTVGVSAGPVRGFFVLIASAALNLITPTVRVLGGFMRARYFSRTSGRSFGFFYGVVLYDQVAHQVVMTICTWITLIATAYVLGRPGLGTGALVLLLVALAALLLWSRRPGSFETNPLVRLLARRAERTDSRLQALYAHGHEAVGVFVRLLAHPPLHVQAVAIGVLYFLVNAAAQWVLFLAIGEHLNPLIVIVVVSLGTAAGTLTGTPGGFGTTEIAMMASFRMMGVDEVLAAAGTLLFRGLHYAAVLAIGLPALALLELRGQDPRPAEEPTDSQERLSAPPEA